MHFKEQRPYGRIPTKQSYKLSATEETIKAQTPEAPTYLLDHDCAEQEEVGPSLPLLSAAEHLLAGKHQPLHPSAGLPPSHQALDDPRRKKPGSEKNREPNKRDEEESTQDGTRSGGAGHLTFKQT